MKVPSFSPRQKKQGIENWYRIIQPPLPNAPWFLAACTQGEDKPHQAGTFSTYKEARSYAQELYPQHTDLT